MVDQQTGTRKVTLRALHIPEAVTVGALAERMHVEPVAVIKQLMRAGIFANINQVVDFETAAVTARTFGFAARRPEESKSNGAAVAEAPQAAAEDLAKLKERPPVVTILGHVDHGKTTLLDAIRKANVAAKEAGGITQHIGAYQVDYKGHPITFLDTPGHEAFTAMRARGAQVTDAAILVVAANDGVMPQTIEAINHIKAAKVPIVVAINKMDTVDADPDRVRRQLSEHDLVVETWGGDVIDVECSAKTGKGLDDVLESILVVSEVAELRANPDRPASGVVVEARLDKSRGPAATVLIQNGTLHLGDHVVVGTVRGKVKALTSDSGRRLRSAGPSTPVELLGLSELPQAGDKLNAAADERSAREMQAEHQRAAEARRARGLTLEEFGSRKSAGQVKELNLVIKTDVQGSIDAIRHAVEQLGTEQTQVRILHAATGSVTESDVLLAAASQAIIVGFNAKPEPGARRIAEQDGVDIREYGIIYRLVEDMQAAIAGMLEPVVKDVVEGKAEVRQVFELKKGRTVAGSYVLDGQLSRGALGRVLRGGKQVHDGPIAGLRRFKDDVREVKAGYECGITLEGFDAFQVGDIIEAHRQQKGS
ncbi:MAG: translation initiation factor IF-2 [SAR202 cluster bacterium]|nr:translation initiation factor IF-2 [SAR202 cluster bacterium]